MNIHETTAYVANDEGHMTSDFWKWKPGSWVGGGGWGGGSWIYTILCKMQVQQ